MPSICVPVTKSNYNFLCVYHPEPIKFTHKDTLGLALVSIIKNQYRGSDKIDEVILRSEFPNNIEIHYATYFYRRNSKINSKCVRAVNNKIKRLIQIELNRYIRIECYKDPDVEIRSSLYAFLSKYGLPDDEKTVATLERQNRRFRTKVGDLKK